jgi:hypothetical protein
MKTRISNNKLSIHPHLVEEWNYARNIDIDITQIYQSSPRRFWWMCSKGHEWQEPPRSRIRSEIKGCPVCFNRRIVVAPENNFAVLFHRSHDGRGCPFCFGIKVGRSNCLATLRPDLAEEWDHDLNGELKPEDVTLGMGKYIYWLCKNGHSFNSRLDARARKTRPNGCPICAESKGESAVRKHLTSNAYNYKEQVYFNSCRYILPLRFDFAFQARNKTIAFLEYQGEQHFIATEYFGGNEGLAKRQKCDQIKRDFCVLNDIPLLEIHYTDIDMIGQIIENFIDGLPLLS